MRPKRLCRKPPSAWRGGCRTSSTIRGRAGSRPGCSTSPAGAYKISFANGGPKKILAAERWRKQARRAQSSDDTSSTATNERIPDPAEPEFGAEWDRAWEKNLFTQALERVRDRIEERQFQIFDLYVMKDWPPEDVARTLGISVARVYLTKHRVSAAVKKEIKILEKQFDQAPRSQVGKELQAGRE